MKSKLPFTSVVSYHTNPMTCGVAKFGKQLAERIGVPFAGISDEWGDSPLLSLKWSELPDSLDVSFIRARCRIKMYGLFWHDAGDQSVVDNFSSGARFVFYADPSLGSPGLWCPSLLTPRKRPVRLFSFGMAGRFQPEKWQLLKDKLDAAGERYHVRVSVGIHEGTSLDGVERHFDALKDVMGAENVTILGILTDDAVAEELDRCDYLVAFFEKGLRANNTTVHAARQANRQVITNCDDDTPDALYMDVNPIDDMPEFREMSPLYSWDGLIQQMERICEASRSTATK
jgi:hypothetical protein